jgi:hypothetical protein
MHFEYVWMYFKLNFSIDWAWPKSGSEHKFLFETMYFECTLNICEWALDWISALIELDQNLDLNSFHKYKHLIEWAYLIKSLFLTWWEPAASKVQANTLADKIPYTFLE